MSRIDLFYRKLLLTKFFTKGWGKPDNLKRLFQFRKIISDRELCRHLVPNDYPIVIDTEEEQDECRIINGHFLSPFTMHLPGIMPEEVKKAQFQMLLPKTWKGQEKPVCVHLAGTGDHHFWRRRILLARPLMKESNIGSVILENPFYGCRKPKAQFRSSLNNVSDLFVMGGALVLESLVLFHWLERQGFGPLGITGISMGGHMASLAASNWHKPLSLIPCLSWSTASTVFTQGVLSGAIPWDFLQKEFKNNNEYATEIVKMIHSPEKSGRTKTEAFLLGQQFHDYFHNLHSVKTGSPDPGKEKLATEPNSDLSQPPLGGSSNSDSLIHPRPGLDTVSNSSHFSMLASKTEQVSAARGQETDSRASLSTYSSLRTVWNIRQRLLNSFQSSNNCELPEDALDFMRGVMDECTHLGNFSVPVDPSLIIIVSATNDAYVPRDRVMSLQELWPGAEVRHINRGHIGAFLMEHHVFRNAIRDSFDRQIEKYHNEHSAERQV